MNYFERLKNIESDLRQIKANQQYDLFNADEFSPYIYTTNTVDSDSNGNIKIKVEFKVKKENVLPLVSIRYIFHDSNGRVINPDSISVSFAGSGLEIDTSKEFYVYKVSGTGYFSWTSATRPASPVYRVAAYIKSSAEGEAIALKG